AAPTPDLLRAGPAPVSVFAAAVAVPDLRPRARARGHDKRPNRDAAPQSLAQFYRPTARDILRSALRDLPIDCSDNHIPPAPPDTVLYAPPENRQCARRDQQLLLASKACSGCFVPTQPRVVNDSKSQTLSRHAVARR